MARLHVSGCRFSRFPLAGTDEAGHHDVTLRVGTERAEEPGAGAGGYFCGKFGHVEPDRRCLLPHSARRVGKAASAPMKAIQESGAHSVSDKFIVSPNYNGASMLPHPDYLTFP
jgi:hypothetical protein